MLQTTQLLLLVAAAHVVTSDIIQNQSACTEYPCLIFHDDFGTLDFSVWEHIISTKATGNDEFQYYTNNRTNSFVKNGALYLKPTLTNDTYDDYFLTNGVLDLWGTSPFAQCTTNSDNGCRKEASKDNMINPIQSAALRTARSFSFQYGHFEARARLPRGDWLWPAIWLMPKYNVYGDWPASGEIDIMESRGNSKLYAPDNVTLVGNQQVAQSLHWGPYYPLNGHDRTLGKKNLGDTGSFADRYHRYGLKWTPDYISFYIDNETTLNVTLNDSPNFWDYGNFSGRAPNAANPWLSGSKLAPFDQEFYIILNLAVGGTNNFFHENYSHEPRKPWDNESKHSEAMKDFWEARDTWLPTWDGNDAAMRIDYIKVWKMQP